MITLMVVAGIALLIAIGYLNHVAENSKLDKARAKLELADRLRRCSEISDTFPGQLVTPALKLLMTRLELNVVQRMAAMDKTDAQIKSRVAELETLAAQGDAIVVTNPVSPILTEAKAIRAEGATLVTRINELNGRAVTIGKNLDGLLTLAERIQKAVL